MSDEKDTDLLKEDIVDTTFIKETPVPEYPREVFDRFGGKKPPLSWRVPDCLKSARSVVYANLSTKNVMEMDLMVAYLMGVAELHKNKLEKEWKSYGVVIGAKDAEISIKDLIDADEKEQPLKVTGTLDKPVTDQDDIWIVHAIFATWRIIVSCKGAIGNYKIELCKRSNYDQRSLFLSHRSNTTATTQIDIGSCADNYINWGDHAILSTLAGLYDMYFYKFSNVPFARIRFGTVISRYRGCGALMAVGFVTKILNLIDQGELFKWVFVNCLKDDCIRIGKVNQEYADLYGYFPYIVDICRIRKSAYSSTLNKNLTTFANFIGALKFRKRCQRALLHKEVPTGDILTNAETVVFATRQSASFMKVVQTRLDKEAKLFKSQDETIDDSAVTNELPPQTKSGDKFILWLQGAKFQIPSEVSEHCKSCAKNITEKRNGTIGEFLKGHYNV